jgi:hypothetical protein
MVAPYLGVDTNWDDYSPGSGTSVVAGDTEAGTASGMGLGSPHIPLAAAFIVLLAMKLFTEADFLTLNPSELKVSFLSWNEVGLMAATWFIMAKVLSGILLQNGVVLWGVPDLIGAL